MPRRLDTASFLEDRQTLYQGEYSVAIHPFPGRKRAHRHYRYIFQTNQNLRIFLNQYKITWRGELIISILCLSDGEKVQLLVLLRHMRDVQMIPFDKELK